LGIKLLGLIFSSVALSSIAQLVLKQGMSSVAVQHALGQGHPLDAIRLVATNFLVVGGLGLYALGAVVWLLVLARADVSFAYPFMGIGFVITMLLGWSVLGEPLGSARLIGTLLIVAGVWLVSSS